MYVLLTREQLIPNLTPDSHNAVTPECEPRFTTLVTPLMAFISNFSRVGDSFSPPPPAPLIINYDYGSGFGLKSKMIVILRRTGSCESGVGGVGTRRSSPRRIVGERAAIRSLMVADSSCPDRQSEVSLIPQPRSVLSV